MAGKKLSELSAEEVRAWWKSLSSDQRDEVTFLCDREEWAALCRAFEKAGAR